MAQQQPVISWERPEEPAGPAPGIEFAGYAERLLAYIVDVIVVIVLITVAAIVFGIVIAAGATSDSNGLAALGVFGIIIAALVVSVGYFPWFWMRGGSTPGMRMFGIRVVRDRDGGQVSGGQAFLRLIGYWVSGAVIYLGYIWIFIDKRRRGWHDLIAGTVVIKER